MKQSEDYLLMTRRNPDGGLTHEVRYMREIVDGENIQGLKGIRYVAQKINHISAFRNYPETKVLQTRF